ncbi:MAG: hypothetical protein SGI77_25495, partial [Pirellulaceae bacterium]|nr:hypothetical protein [Pirellulaceae bacterium]
GNAICRVDVVSMIPLSLISDSQRHPSLPLAYPCADKSLSGRNRRKNSDDFPTNIFANSGLHRCQAPGKPIAA